MIIGGIIGSLHGSVGTTTNINTGNTYATVSAGVGTDLLPGPSANGMYDAANFSTGLSLTNTTNVGIYYGQINLLNPSDTGNGFGTPGFSTGIDVTETIPNPYLPNPFQNNQGSNNQGSGSCHAGQESVLG